MLGQYIVFGIIFYFLSLFLSGALAFVDRSFINAAWLFIVSNIVGCISGVLYFFGFFGYDITIAHFDWFFQFSPHIASLSAIFFILISGVSAVVGVYSVRYLTIYEKTYDPRSVLFMMAFFVLGMQGVIVSNNTFSFLFFWELMSITSFFLVFVDRTEQSISAAFLYFIMTHLGASAILGGFLILGNGSFLFELSGIYDAAQMLSPALRNTAFLLFVFGFGSKAGLVPFHIWLPEAHPQAPSNISALMSGLMLKIAIYGFVMIILAMGQMPVWIALIVLFLGILSSIVGALYAVVERDMKRAFAYSSIENMGIIFSMFGLALYFFAQNASLNVEVIGVSIVAFALFHAISHALFKTALFLASGVVISHTHTKSLDAMGGLAKVMPFFTFGFLVVTLSALPIPPFGTFYGEWGFVQNIIFAMRDMIMESKTIILLLGTLIVTGLVSGLAIFAMIRIFSLSMLGLSHDPQRAHRDEKKDHFLIMPIVFLGSAVLVCGFFASAIVDMLTFAVYTGGGYARDITMNIAPHMATMVGMGTVLCFFVGVVIHMWIKKNTRMRTYHTWDCGQPIDATMQYSATAFCAPIRFFFLTFIGRKKVMSSQPITQSNPWIVKNTFTLSIRSKWSDIFYAPIAKILLFIADQIRFVQNGRIQYYVLFLLLALILTLIFAL